MRQGNSNKRMRGRGSGGGGGGGSPRKGPNPLSRTYESTGPDVKIRGTAMHIAEKYVTLARDAQSSGDPVLAENYLQHAEHYYRIIAAAQAQMPQPMPIVRSDIQDEDEEDEIEAVVESRGETRGETRAADLRDDDGYMPADAPQPYVDDMPGAAGSAGLARSERPQGERRLNDRRPRHLRSPRSDGGRGEGRDGGREGGRYEAARGERADGGRPLRERPARGDGGEASGEAEAIADLEALPAFLTAPPRAIPVPAVVDDGDEASAESETPRRRTRGGRGRGRRVETEEAAAEAAAEAPMPSAPAPAELPFAAGED